MFFISILLPLQLAKGYWEKFLSPHKRLYSLVYILINSCPTYILIFNLTPYKINTREYKLPGHYTNGMQKFYY